MSNWFKKGVNPTGSGAPFIIVLTFLIIFYILFLPADDRAALLDENVIPSTGTSSQTSQTSVSIQTEQTFIGPGLVQPQTRETFEHLLGTFQLRGDYEAQVLERFDTFTISTTVFQQRVYTNTFEISDLQHIRNPIMTFTVPSASGILTITLNGFEIFSGEVQSFNVGPIELRSQHLRQHNEITFSVSSPGISFWRENFYQIQDVRILADTLDASGLSARQTFELRPIEIQQLQSARLRFIADCDETQQLGRLTITMNQREIFSSIPDCGMINTIPISRGFLRDGVNSVEFESTFGTFLIDRVEVRTTLERDEGTTFFFELDEEYFSGSTNRSLHNDYRVIADFQFVDDSRHKQAEVVVNGFRTSIDTRQRDFQRDISEFVQPFNNYIQVIPRSEFTFVQMKVRLENR